jgi:serine/threonine-protein kinase
VTVPNRYREQPPRTGWYALAAFFALVALGLGGFLLFNTLAGKDDPSDRTLQDYVGDPVADVTRDLLDRHINYVLEIREDTRFGEGIVNGTDPAAGVVIQQSGTVTVFYNEDTAEAAIPPLDGMSEAEARDALAALGFADIQVRREENDSVANGLVIGTDPAEGETVPVQDAVTLIVSLGDGSAAGTAPGSTAEGELAVPFVIGLSEGAARDKLADFDVTVTYFTVSIGNQNDGKVMDQDPHVNETLNEGDPVEIIVGRAPEAPPPTQATTPPTQATTPPTQATTPPTQATTPPTQATTPPTQPSTTTTTVAAPTTT